MIYIIKEFLQKKLVILSVKVLYTYFIKNIHPAHEPYNWFDLRFAAKIIYYGAALLTTALFQQDTHCGYDVWQYM